MSDWVPLRAMGTFTRRSPTGMLIETYHDGYEVNETGAYIWSKVGSGLTVSQIATEVAGHYEVTPDVAAQAVTDFMADLVERGFVVRHP
jgi:hypothetical protein